MTPGLDPTSDPVFAGLFADERPSDAGGGGGEARRGMLRPYQPAEPSVLAAAATGSALVTDALALVDWVGENRPVSETGRLEPAAAIEAAAKIGLPTEDLSELQLLWTATIAAGLIQLEGSTEQVSAGPAASPEPTEPTAHLDRWSRLVVGLLRARAETNSQHDTVGGLGLASTPLYYTLARDPMPAGLPALVLATSMGEDDDFDPAWMVHRLPDAIDMIARDWAWAGVLLPLESISPEDAEGLDELFEELAGDAEDSTGPLGRLLKPLVEAVQESPVVQLTALGDYGLRRVLLAHGWQVPLVGEAAEVSPDKLLDLLVAYPPEDALAEAEIWLESRGDEWESALRQVTVSARSKNPDWGPGRRAALGAVLRQIGPPVLPLLDTLAGDPWLSAVAADARFELGLGPEPTMAEELWLIVDGISIVLQGTDEEKAEAVDDSAVLEFLRLPGALAAAAELSHPHARLVLELVVNVSGDRELANQLRQAFEPGSGGRPGRGRPKQRRR